MEIYDQLHTPAASSPEIIPRYPLNRRLLGPRIGLDDVAKTIPKSLHLVGIETRTSKLIAACLYDQKQQAASSLNHESVNIFMTPLLSTDI